MSDNTASLRHQIDSADELQSVVRTMKAVAASSIGQYEKSVRALSDYYRTVELGLSVCMQHSEVLLSNTVRNSKSNTHVIGAVVFGSDQGLVGQFNERITDYAMQTFGKLNAKPSHVWAVGERVQARLSDAGSQVTGQFTVPNSVQAIAPLVGKILVATESGDNKDDITELHLFYNRPTIGAGYEPVTQQLLPLDDNWRNKLIALPWPTKYLPEVLGDNTATLRTLIREYLFISLFRACTESLASENASRLAAMLRADKNIDGLLEQLHSTFHRIRQSSIDEELFDVISGFEALSSESR